MTEEGEEGVGSELEVVVSCPAWVLGTNSGPLRSSKCS